MQRDSVVSSNVASLGYDPATETLEVEFLSGSIYQYYNVPEIMYDRMKRAQSKGEFLHMHVKNAYPYSRVG